MSPSSRDTARVVLARARVHPVGVAGNRRGCLDQSKSAAGVAWALGAALSMGGIAEVAGRLTASA